MAGVCLSIGIVGVVLPLVPGVIFLVAGLALLSSANTLFANWLDERLMRYPKMQECFVQVKTRFFITQ